VHPSSSKAVRYLLDELCRKFGFCSALRTATDFQPLVEAGAAHFARELFLAEGWDPSSNPALAKAVENFIAAAFERWEGYGAV
jgi:hypothetical protein